MRTAVQCPPEIVLGLVDGALTVFGHVPHVEATAEEGCHLEQLQRLVSPPPGTFTTYHDACETRGPRSAKSDEPRYIGRQITQVLRHEFHHVVGETSRLYFLQVPLPSSVIVVEPLHRAVG